MYTVGAVLLLVGLAIGIKLPLLVQIAIYLISTVSFLPFHKKFEGLAIGVPIASFIIFGIGILIGNVAYLLQK